MCSVCRTGTYENIKLKIIVNNNNCQTPIHGTFIEHNDDKYNGFQVYIVQNNVWGYITYLWRVGVVRGDTSQRYYLSDAVGSDAIRGWEYWDGTSGQE